MKSSWIRTLGLLWMLACAGAQASFGSPLAAGALTFGIHASDHAHSMVLLQRDGDHLDVVISHAEGEPRHHAAVPQHGDHLASFSDGDHVVHITGGAAASSTSRRAIADSAPVVSISPAARFASASASAPAALLEPRARRVEHLRTVVLRL